MSEDIFKNLEDSIVQFDDTQAEGFAKQVLANGANALEIIDKALKPAMDRLGEDFEEFRIGLPELVVAGDIALKISDIIDAALVSEKESLSKGIVAIGTVKGDIHSIGKNIVGVMLRAYGFKVLDLGTDVSPDQFLEAAEQADAIGLSGLLTLAAKSMKQTVDKVHAQYPDKTIIVGGAAMDPEIANRMGVLFGPDAAAGVQILEAVLNK